MSVIKKKTCPITCSDEIVVTFPNPNELVSTQRKTSDGKYERVLKPRKEVKKALLPDVRCPSLGHPVLHAPRPLGKQLWKKGISWCKKTRKECPIEQVTQDLL
jgi:hypothetical protein